MMSAALFIVTLEEPVYIGLLLTSYINVLSSLYSFVWFVYVTDCLLRIDIYCNIY